MKYLILRPFNYSTNGISSDLFEKGDVKEIDAAHAPGLQAEGYIEPAAEDAAEAEKPVELDPVAENAENDDPVEVPVEEAAEEVPTTSGTRPARSGAKSGRR